MKIRAYCKGKENAITRHNSNSTRKYVVSHPRSSILSEKCFINHNQCKARTSDAELAVNNNVTRDEACKQMDVDSTAAVDADVDVRMDCPADTEDKLAELCLAIDLEFEMESDDTFTYLADEKVLENNKEQADRTS